MNSKRIYFPGLQGLRGIAAFAVIIPHINIHLFLFNSSFSLDHVNPLNYHIADLAVTFFFTLSGFLITYLLLREEAQTSNIDIGAFYKRRILRIWPLYYLIIGIAAVIVYRYNPGNELKMNSFGLSLGLYVFLFSNVTYSLHYSFLPAIQTWSIGVEEQFYLIWPWLFRRSKHIYEFILLFFICFTGIKLILMYESSHGVISEFWGFLIEHTRLDCMAVGGLGAFMLYHRFRVIEWLFHPWVQRVSFGLLFLFLITRQTFSVLHHTVYSGFFLILIMNVSSNTKSVINVESSKWYSLENKFFKFLGRISYGIYMYHMLYLILITSIYHRYLMDVKIDEYRIYYIYMLISLLTVGTAYLSYQYFEKPFMKLKVKYAKVESGEQVRSKINIPK